MRAVSHFLDMSSRSVSYLLGSFVLVLAVGVLVTGVQVPDIAAWVEEVFGIIFVVLFTMLMLIALLCWVKTTNCPSGHDAWLEAGLQAASGVTTLALTFTLLGISLGISSLAGQELTPETVHEVIKGLTKNFSLAFMTTVVGLPVSAVLRALLLVTHARNQKRMVLTEGIKGEV